jgi:excisionase family DNA binding protein
MDGCCSQLLEAARTLSIGRSTIYNLMRDGALASVKVGRSRRVSAAALLAYVEHLGRSVADSTSHAADPSDRCAQHVGPQDQLR